MAEQLAVQFEHKEYWGFENFYPGHNLEAVNQLKSCVTGNGDQQIWLWGAKGLGKSHLLQACCNLAQQLSKKVFYYSFSTPNVASVELLNDLEVYEIVCFDDLENICSNKEWELGFFNFYNRQRDLNHKMIFSSRYSPQQLNIDLPDLKTRLNWGLSIKLHELSDDESIKAFTYRANQMGFEIDDKIGRFLLSHYARNLTALWNLLEQLDKATLSAKRKLTLPFLKEILARNAE